MSSTISTVTSKTALSTYQAGRVERAREVLAQDGTFCPDLPEVEK